MGHGSVTPMQLIKLVYVAHGYMLGKHGSPLLDESVQAWRYGPVVPSVYHAVKSFGSMPVEHVPGALDDAIFSEDEKAVMAEVAEIYGKHNAITLSSATHQRGTPWFQTWEAIGKNAPISNDLIESFYAGILKLPTHSSL
jgi:uncharacterized phage-associated protein